MLAVKNNERVDQTPSSDKHYSYWAQNKFFIRNSELLAEIAEFSRNVRHDINKIHLESGQDRQSIRGEQFSSRRIHKRKQSNLLEIRQTRWNRVGLLIDKIF